MNPVALGDVVTFTNGGTPSRSKDEFWNGSIPWITGADITDDGVIAARSFISQTAVSKSSTNVLPEGTVLLLTRTSVGKVGVLPMPMAINQDITAITPSSRVDTRYLVHFLKSSKSKLLSNLRGATIKGVTRDDVASLELPLPSLPEQRRIAAILDHADALRAKRCQVLVHLDTLTQSIFHDMFGDPDDSSVDLLFGSLTNLSGGRSLVADDSTAESPFRVLKISAVTTGQFKPEESKPLPSGYIPPPDHLIQRGDLLMSRANTTELVGAVAYVNETPSNLALPDKVWRFTWKVDAEPVFYHALLSTPSIRRRISRLSSGTGGTMKNVSKSKLEGMKLPNISLSLQRDFVDRAQRVTAQYALVNRSTLADDELFASLQSRAFRGEL